MSRGKKLEMFYVIPKDGHAPERLRGKEVKAILAEGKFTFLIDMPDDPTGQESGYFKWFVGEVMDKIQKAVPELEVGDKVYKKVEESNA